MRRHEMLFARIAYAIATILLPTVAAHAQSVAASRVTTAGQTVQEQVNVKSSAAPLDYTTSWIGNSFGGGNDGPNQLMKHVPLDIDAVYVTDDGKVYTNTGWDEGGRSLTTFKDGNIINPLNSVNENNGAGDTGGGFAVAADDKYVYQAEMGTGTGVKIKNVNDHSNAGVSLTGSSTLTSTAEVYGMALAHKRLYVTESDFNKVEVFDTNTLKLVSSLTIPNPARVAVDCLGGIWVSHLDLTTLPPGDTWGKFGTSVIDHYNVEGVLLGSITVPDNAEVTALWIDQRGKDGNDRLFVGDDGADPNVKSTQTFFGGTPS